MKRLARIMAETFAICIVWGGVTSCSNQNINIVDDNGIKTLAAPAVKGKSYPGVNYVYWDNVPNASKGYDYLVYENGVLKNSTPVHTNKTFIIDTDLQYDIQKQYKIWATGDRTSRVADAFFQEGSSGSISLTPILPPYTTKATELAKYENGYKSGGNYTLTAQALKYQLSSETVSIEADSNTTGRFFVTFPAKAYLSYKIYADKGNQASVFGEHELEIASYQDFAVNNKFVTVSGILTQAGEYTITVEAESVNSNYVNSEEIQVTNKLFYDVYNIEGSTTAENIQHSYISNSKVRLSWNPVKNTDGSLLKTENYIVYRNIAGSTEYSIVSGEIKSVITSSSSEPTYYLTDYIDSSIDYIYTFVAKNESKIAENVSRHTVNSQLLNSSTDGFTVITTLYDADNDGLLNDARIIVKHPVNSTELKVTYGIGTSEQDAKDAAVSSNSKTIALEGQYSVYYLEEKNVVSNFGEYLAVALTVTEPSKNSVTIFANVVEYTSQNVDSSNIKISEPVWYAADGNYINDDISFRIERAAEDGDSISNFELSVKYAVSDESAAVAKDYLDTAKAKSLDVILTGKEYYEINSDNFPVLKDIGKDSILNETGLYFAAKVTVSEKNKEVQERLIVSASPSADLNPVKTAKPENLVLTLIALDDDGIANDIKATFDISDEQYVGSMYYSTAGKTEIGFDASTDSVKRILKNRLDTEGYRTIIDRSNLKQLYKKDSRIYYELSYKADISTDSYVMIGINASQRSLEDSYSYKYKGPVTENQVVLEETASPVLSTNALYLSDSGYGKYTTVSCSVLHDNNLDISIGVNQTIKSVKLAQAPTKNEILEFLAASYVPEYGTVLSLYIPDEYTLQTEVVNKEAILTKKYSIPCGYNLTLGNMGAIEIVISETGKKDCTKTIFTTQYNRSIDSPAVSSIKIPAVASQIEITKPAFTVTNKDSTGEENELVHVVIYDNYDFYDSYYSYSLERTTEKSYNEGSPIWETVEENITPTVNKFFSYDYSNGYNSGRFGYFEKYYRHELSGSSLDGTSKDIDAGTSYVYRVTKTRSVQASVTGKEESVTVDAKITPKTNIKAPSINFESYKIGELTVTAKDKFELNFDSKNKYDYALEYRIHYGQTSSSYYEDFTSWTAVTDSKITWNVSEEFIDSVSYATYKITASIDEYFYSNGYTNAVLEVRLTKKYIDRDESEDFSTDLLDLTWTNIAEITSDSGITLNVKEYTNYYYFSTNSYSYDSIDWYVDGTQKSSSGNTFTLYKADISAGSHEVLVVVKKSGIIYSASALITYDGN